jgi:hypothetical protein
MITCGMKVLRSLIGVWLGGIILCAEGAETNAVLTRTPFPEAWKEELLKKPIRAFCVDFIWQPSTNGWVFAKPGDWANADPAAHVAWHESLGVNCIQTFVVTCNGYAWYKGGPIPAQPGLKYDFLPEVVRLGHAKKMLVIGYYSLGANSLWGLKHPDLSYGTPSATHIPLTSQYLDYLCASIQDALERTGIDGFMLDLIYNTSGLWLDCEKVMYRELMGRTFPGLTKISEEERMDFNNRALARAWKRIHETVRRMKPESILWINNLYFAPGLLGGDWFLNESPDIAELEKMMVRMKDKPVRLIQNEMGWGNHDPRFLFSDLRYASMDFYGFAMMPGDNALPRPVAEYLDRSVADFQKTVDLYRNADFLSVNERNLAALARFYLGLPLGYVTPIVVIDRQPADVVSAPGRTAQFSVAAHLVKGNYTNLTCQWQQNGVDISEATNTTHITGILGPADVGAKFRCVFRYPGYPDVISDEATLTFDYSYARGAVAYANQPTYNQWPASRLVDGDWGITGFLCGAMGLQSGFAYEIDLGLSLNLSNIVIYARQDGLFAERLTAYRVTVHLDDPGQIGREVWRADLHTDHTNPGSGPDCKDELTAGMDPYGRFQGQWIRIQSLQDPVPNYALQISEVVVIGRPAQVPDPVLRIQRQGKSVAVMWNGGALESTSNYAGPWIDVRNASNPFLAPSNAPTQFYRARQ